MRTGGIYKTLRLLQYLEGHIGLTGPEKTSIGKHDVIRGGECWQVTGSVQAKVFFSLTGFGKLQLIHDTGSGSVTLTGRLEAEAQYWTFSVPRRLSGTTQANLAAADIVIPVDKSHWDLNRADIERGFDYFRDRIAGH